MDPELTAHAAAGADDETMVVSKTRLRSFLQDLDALRAERDSVAAERDAAAGELEELRGEHEALQAHLEGTLAENIRLRERLAARGAGADPRQGPQEA
jgi:predicted nuclease with TOPRIM domain